jgi:hypothetical protein
MSTYTTVTAEKQAGGRPDHGQECSQGGGITGKKAICGRSKSEPGGAVQKQPEFKLPRESLKWSRTKQGVYLKGALDALRGKTLADCPYISPGVNIGPETLRGAMTDTWVDGWMAGHDQLKKQTTGARK